MTNEEDQCLICINDIDDILIDYSHDCGTYKIHQKCSDEWFMKNIDSCVICRNNIIQDPYDITYNNNLIPDIINENVVPIIEDNNQDNNLDRRYKLYSFIYTFFIGVLIFGIVIYFINK